MFTDSDIDVALGARIQNTPDLIEIIPEEDEESWDDLFNESEVNFESSSTTKSNPKTRESSNSNLKTQSSTGNYLIYISHNSESTDNEPYQIWRLSDSTQDKVYGGTRAVDSVAISLDGSTVIQEFDIEKFCFAGRVYLWIIEREARSPSGIF